MSELKVDKITPRQGTTLTLGDSGDTINFGSGVLPNFENLTVTGDLTVDTNSLKVDSTNNFVGIGTASPSSALDIVGNIVVSGTVDGRDIATDGTKLDTIATNATANPNAIDNVVEDTTPQLGGNLDLNSNNITGTGNIDVTGSGTFSGDLTVDTNTLYVDSSNNRVGLFNTSPQVDLDIKKSGFVVAKLHNYDGTNPSNGVALDFLEGSQIDNVFGGASTYGFRLKLDGATNSFIIKSGNQTTINDRFAIERDTGNVGIGTTSPDGTLHVHNGSAGTITAAAAANDLVIESDSATGISILSDDTNVNAYGNIYFGNETDGNQIGRITYFGSTYVTAGDREAMRFNTGGSERMRLQGSSVVFNETGADTNFRVESDTETHALFVDGGNNVIGVGTSAPDSPIHVKRNTTSGSQLLYPSIHLENEATGTSYAFLQIETNNGATDGGILATVDHHEVRTNQYLTFRTGASFTERIRTDSNGNVQISGFYGQAVGAGENSGQGFFFSGTTNKYAVFGRNGTSANLYIAKTLDTTTGDAIRFDSGGNDVGSINVTASSTAYTTSSDYRLKENVVEMTGATERLKQLQPKRFNFIVDADTTVDGFLAHEVSSVVPEAISGTYNEVEVWKEDEELPEGVSVGDNKLDDEGNTIPVYQGIDQSKLVPLLTASLKEAINKIEQLEARISALET